MFCGLIVAYSREHVIIAQDKYGEGLKSEVKKITFKEGGYVLSGRLGREA